MTWRCPNCKGTVLVDREEIGSEQNGIIISMTRVFRPCHVCNIEGWNEWAKILDAPRKPNPTQGTQTTP